MRPADWQNTPFTLPLLLIGLLCGWSAYVGWRRRAFPGAASFAVLMAALAGWALVNLVEKSLVNQDLRRAVSAFVYVFIVTVPGAWLVFAARFARPDRRLSPRVMALLFLEPVLVLGLVFTNSSHGLFRTATEMRTDGPYTIMVITQGPLFYVNAAYTYLLFVAGAILLVASVARRPGGTGGRIGFVLGAMLVPLLGNISYVCHLQPAWLTDLTPVYFAVPGLATAWLLFRVRLFDVRPIARDFVLDCLDDAVFVLDTHLRILDANPAARSLLPDPQRVRQQPLAEALPELGRCLSTPNRASKGTTEIQLRLAGAEQFWDVHLLPLTDHDVLVGVLVRLANVTERRRAEAELQEAESRFRQLAENIHGVFWIADSLKPQMLYISPAYEEIWGCTCQSLYEQPQSFLEGIHVEDRERIRDTIQRQSRGEYTNEEYRVVRPDGSARWVWDRGFPIRDQAGQVYRVGGIAEDVTAQKQAEEAVASSERRFRALVENSWDGVKLVSGEGTILYTNPATQRNLGYPAEELVGRNNFEWMHPEDQPAMKALLAQLRHEPGGSRMAQYRIRHRDGSWRWWESAATNLLADPSVRAIVVNYRDITETKRLEEELRQRAEQLTEADRRKDEFLAMLAHELRNPLAPLRNGLEILKVPGAGGEHIEPARQMMERQVQQLVRLVDDLLDVARITRGKIQLHKEPVELAPAVARALETSRPLIDARKQELTVSLPQEPLRLEADLTRLAQVIGNLLNNAAKYTGEGGHIWLTAERQGNEVLVRVRDTGIGMTAEMLARAFDLFAQADHALDRSQGGLGIGLTLVRRLVELHHGSVQALSDGPGKGSEFVVRLPVLQQPPSESLVPKERESPWPSRRVLVVDDNVDAAESLAVLLRMAGHEVYTAHGGLAALEAAQVHRPEVVLLDLGMPGMDGLEVARRLRQDLGLKDTLLLALTGYGHEEDRRHSQEAGFDAHLVKPVDLDTLHTLLAQAPALAPGY
jgi:PAS domain S-box-containing protein